MGRKLTALTTALAGGATLAAAGALSGIAPLDMDSYSTVFWILLFIAVPLNIIVFFHRTGSGVKKGTSYIGVSVICGFLLAGGVFMYLEAVTKAGSLYGKLLLFVVPLFSTLLALLVRKEKSAISKAAASLVAALGAGFLVFHGAAPQGDFSTEGFLFAVGGAAAFAMFILLSTGTKAGAGVKTYIYVNSGMLMALVLMLVKGKAGFPAVESLPRILMWAAIGFVIIYLATLSAHAAGASYWGVAAYAVPVVLMLYDVVLKSGSADFLKLAGLGLIVAALIFRGAYKT